MPPASSHLAERPVPAPPPTMGWPAATLPRKLSRMVFRAMRGMVFSSGGPGGGLHADGAPRSDQRIGEGFVVHVERQALQLAPRAATEVLLDGLEQRPVGRGIVELLARLVQGG